jgi:glycosyltransferase involved in cell wall biosynthesis
VKILHVIPSISPLRGGPSTAAIAMVGALREQGVDASLLTTNDHGSSRADHPDLITGRWSEHQGLPVLAFPRWNPPLAAVREYAVSPGLSRWLGGHLHQYDLIHVHALFSYPSTSAMRQARRQGVPYVVRTIGQLDRWSLQQSARRKQWMLRLIERRNLEGAAALHFTTRAEEQEVGHLGLAPRSLVLPLGVKPLPPPPLEQAAEDGTIRFLFLSRLHPKKKLESLLEALALLAGRRSDAVWELQIAGSGEPAYEQELRRKILALGLEDRCRWLGFLRGEAKWQALRQADWFVLPSASENFGIAVAEALAAGTPVIVSPQVAIAAEVAAAGAGKISESEPSQLANVLEQALAGPETAMRERALNLARTEFSWDTIATRLIDSYSELISTPPKAPTSSNKQ